MKVELTDKSAATLEVVHHCNPYYADHADEESQEENEDEANLLLSGQAELCDCRQRK
jgi:hypothetical protein